MMVESFLGFLFFSASSDVSYIYTILSLQKEPFFHNMLRYSLLSSHTIQLLRSFPKLLSPISIHFVSSSNTTSSTFCDPAQS